MMWAIPIADGQLRRPHWQGPAQHSTTLEKAWAHERCLDFGDWMSDSTVPGLLHLAKSQRRHTSATQVAPSCSQLARGACVGRGMTLSDA